MTFFMSRRSVDIMVKNKSELLLLGPARPTFRWISGFIVYGPDVCVRFPFLKNYLASDKDLEPTWN
jgi:hypothetical protein